MLFYSSKVGKEMSRVFDYRDNRATNDPKATGSISEWRIWVKIQTGIEDAKPRIKIRWSNPKERWCKSTEVIWQQSAERFRRDKVFIPLIVNHDVNRATGFDVI